MKTRESYKPFLDLIGGAVLGHRAVLENTVDLMLRCMQEKVYGEYAEAGVFAGCHPAIMGRILIDHGNGNPVHLFDSFEGIPLSGPKDDETINTLVPRGDGKLVSSGVSACSAEQVLGHLKMWGLPLAPVKSLANKAEAHGQFVFHRGWFQDTLPIAAPMIPAIALLRLDADLYESTRVCMEHLFPKVSVGGFVVIDDFGLTGCRRAVVEYLDAHGIRPTIIPIAGAGGPVYFRKPAPVAPPARQQAAPPVTTPPVAPAPQTVATAPAATTAPAPAPSVPTPVAPPAAPPASETASTTQTQPPATTTPAPVVTMPRRGRPPRNR